MTGPAKSPKRPSRHKPKMAAIITAIGDGWTGGRSRPTRIRDYVHHRETWMDDMAGTIYNTCRKRKNKRDFPEFPPLSYPLK